ncbi:maleylpyruvate isomerase N-terminal domain-containing protein [Oerskovia sp. KBS0722]|uniref:maleylpyruvate isomerase N-terminal domain-containing protein n=1 Tax=Oerskovia sp. KBS0722 TaxID=1179673 RepID=UPI00110D68C0|nr:maleylpyruvate isomerase N-terminal domain-containing protein [Oerskovia sp. KBS0722]QDW61216.1 maleylpyruvate isomerase family protein [Oerskovia sp. KBS0722]
MTADLAEATAALRTQWDRLERWLGSLDDTLDDAVDQPSVLAGWTVGELVSHLGRAMDALVAAGPVAPGTNPLTLAEYLGTYPERAEQIAQVTRTLDEEIATDRLTAVSGYARRAFARLDELAPTETVVQARRGPITLRDMVVSRLIELVVHADDLERSLPGVTEKAVDRGALDLVAAELLRIVVTRGGWSLEVVDPRLWVRLATGRIPYDVDDLARALAPLHTSDSVPDLGRMLPLL